MSKHNAKGRSARDAKHVRLYWWELETEAYRSLGPHARALLVELKFRFNGNNNGFISLSQDEAAGLLNCARGTAAKAFADLEAKGFVKARQRGSFGWKVRHATEWILTAEEYDGKLPTKDFRRWPEKKPGPSHVPDGSTRCTREGQNHPHRGSTRCTTIGIPGRVRPTALRVAGWPVAIGVVRKCWVRAKHWKSPLCFYALGCRHGPPTVLPFDAPSSVSSYQPIDIPTSLPLRPAHR